MYQVIINSFCEFITCEWTPTDLQIEELKSICDFSNNNGYSCSTNYKITFIEAVNQKLANNQFVYQHILDIAFKNNIKLNYLLKNEIRLLLDKDDKESYYLFLKKNNIVTEEMKEAFQPIGQEETVQLLKSVVDNDKQYTDILCSIFSRYCFNLFDKHCMSRYFSGLEYYSDDYFEFISEIYLDMCKRDNALVFIDVSQDLFLSGYEHGCNKVLNNIKLAFDTLNNHCDMVVYIPDIEINKNSIQWELFSDIVLYSEKMNPERIDKIYFRWKKIKETTESYIPTLKTANTRFNIAFQGFIYKDCFVVKETEKYSLLLVFEKNQRDERLLYCPACRSLHVEGNSYPILNVRSWECQNPLCPDRSKYNRGKRYSFSSIMRQKLMADEVNRIPEQSIAFWRLDCLESCNKLSIFEMIVRHYSCVNDGISVFTCSPDDFVNNSIFGRYLHLYSYGEEPLNLLSDFKKSDYFNRYLQHNVPKGGIADRWIYGSTTVYNADAFEVLKIIDSNSIDGAVTSPPYYNAKEYSQWDNIYCYLYDMYNVSVEIYRVLKPGSIYLFNIFDYFDNEKNIVFSAMGNKRMILGAYMLDIFKRVGFSIQGNIIWHKGEIQGNRNFNQGNLSPYYQAPLNCWEHIFILSKGAPTSKYKKLQSHIAEIRPVVKMVRGKNTLGHTAPYPLAIPNLLLDYMTHGDTILDPFLGSGTTSIAAEIQNICSIGIEKKREYFDLCKKLIIERSTFQLSLDSTVKQRII